PAPFYLDACGFSPTDAGLMALERARTARRVDSACPTVEVPGSSADDAGVNTPRWVRVIELLKTLPMIAFFVACQSGTVTTPPTVPPSTQVSVFAPYGSETLNGDITVSETVKGSC